MRFEKFKNILIPIERVMWVEFDAKGDWLNDNTPCTRVWIAVPGGLTRAIDFKGNQLNKFQEWLKQFPEVGSCLHAGNPITADEYVNDKIETVKNTKPIIFKTGLDTDEVDQEFPDYTYTKCNCEKCHSSMNCIGEET